MAARGARSSDAIPLGRWRLPLAGGAADRLLRTVLVSLAYFVCARLAYTFAVPGGVVTVWPASGLLLGLLLTARRRDWAFYLVAGAVGSVLSDLRSGYQISGALAAAFANGTESLVAATVVNRWLRRRASLATVRDVAALVLGAAVISNALTAWIGGTVLHIWFHAKLLSGWSSWWIGDGLGMLIIAPVIIAAATHHERRRDQRARWLEGIAGFAAIIVVSLLSLRGDGSWAVRVGDYAILPLVLWAALRLGSGGASLATLVVAAIATRYASLGIGPFAAAGSASATTTAMQLYAFLAAVSLTSLFTSAAHEEREAAGANQRASEARYRVIVEAATDAIVTVDEQGAILFANAAVERIFGHAPAQLIGRDIASLVAPEGDRHESAGSGSAPPHGGSSVPWRSATLIGRHRDGGDIPLEASFGERVENRQRLYTGILRDITEKRAAESALDDAEARMHFALEAARVGTWEIDFATGRSRWSATLEALHGMPAGSFAGTFEAFLNQIYLEDRDVVKDEIERATRDHTDSNILYRSVWPDGSTHWVSGVGRTFYDASGAPIRAAGIGLDVTEQRSLQEQYRQSQKMDAIGQLAGGVAHDFNNLLTAIQGYGSMLAQSLPSGSTQREDVNEILRAADRAAALTRQLLAFSRRQVLAPRPLQIAESISGLESMLRRLIGEHIDFTVRLDPDAGQVLADPGQIEQVVLNLCVNARDAMPGGGQLRVQVSNVEISPRNDRVHLGPPVGSYVVLSVTDTGCGMDAATVERVFEPFFTTKPPDKGTGLGLSTVYGIVQQSGGVIQVFSQPGRGSTFTVYLPRTDLSVDAGDAVDVRRVCSGTENVLLVEDDSALRKMAARALEIAGYRVSTAGAPREAVQLALAASSSFDLLITDVVLPEMSGRALAEQLLAMHPRLKVLYMSGYTDDAIVRQGVFAHETQFIHKPFDHDALLRKAREVLDLVVT